MGTDAEQVAPLVTESIGRLYSPHQIGAAAFIGSPLAACWMLARNYTEFGERALARRALLLGLLGTAGLFAIAFALPENSPRRILPLAYSFGIWELAKVLQGTKVKAHLAAGGQRQSNWRVAGAALIGLLLALAVAFVVALLRHATWKQ
jgi:hypothetical protein